MERMTILELRDRLNFYMEKLEKDAPVYFGLPYSELWEDMNLIRTYRLCCSWLRDS